MSMLQFVLLAALVASISAQALTVNTPPSVQACLPVQITWAGGKPPVYISLIPGGQPGGPTVKDFGPQTGNSLTWNVDQPVGTSLTVQGRDSTGVLNYSDKFTVQPSGTTCPTGGASSGPSNSSAATPKPGTTTTPTNSSAAKPGNTSTSLGTSSNTTPSSSSPTSSTSNSSASSTPATPSSSTASGSAPTSDASRAAPGVFALGLAAFLSMVL